MNIKNIFKADVWHQFGLLWKFRVKHFFEGIFKSDFIGNTVMVLLYSTAITFFLSLWYTLSIHLFLSSVGAYFIFEEILSRIDKWFENFRRS